MPQLERVVVVGAEDGGRRGGRRRAKVAGPMGQHNVSCFCLRGQRPPTHSIEACMARYELNDKDSSKYWEIVLEGNETRVSYGKLGTVSEPAVKAFKSPEMARKEYDKLVAEKLKKGYQLVPSPIAGQVNIYGPARALVHPWRGSAYCRTSFEIDPPIEQVRHRFGELLETRSKNGLALTESTLRPMAERVLSFSSDDEPFPCVKQAAVTLAYGIDLLSTEELPTLLAWLIESKGLLFALEAAIQSIDYDFDCNHAYALVKPTAAWLRKRAFSRRRFHIDRPVRQYFRERIAIVDDAEYQQLRAVSDKYSTAPLWTRSWVAYVLGDTAKATQCAMELINLASKPGVNRSELERKHFLRELITTLDDSKLITAYCRCVDESPSKYELFTVAARLGNVVVELCEEWLAEEDFSEVLAVLHTPEAAHALLRCMSRKARIKTITAYLAQMGPVARKVIDAIPESSPLFPYTRAVSAYVTNRPAVSVPPLEPLAKPSEAKVLKAAKKATKAPLVLAAPIASVPHTPIPQDEPPIRRCTSPGGYGLVLGLASNGDVALAVGGQGQDIFLATTDGQTFQEGRSPGKGLRGACIHDGTLWITGEYGFLAKSTDGGRRWDTIALQTSACLFSVVADSHGWLWVAGDNGFVVRSKDGNKFTRMKGVKESIGRMSSSPLGVLIPTDEPGKLYIARENNIHSTPLSAGVDLLMARVTPRGTLLVVGCGGLVFRSEDGGSSFEKINIGTPRNLYGLDCFEDGRVVAVGEDGLLIVSYDDGRSFKPLVQNITHGDFWCCLRHGEQMLIGGEDCFLLAMGPRPAAPKQPRSLASFFAKAEEAPAPVRPEWAAPPPSTGFQIWTAPAALPLERRNGLYVSPLLRSHLWPRRGGITTAIRPLPTLDEAWAALRACIWQASTHKRKNDKDTHGLWSLLIDDDKENRALGERLFEPVARKATQEEDAALFQLCTKQYSRHSFVQHSPWASLTETCFADYLVAAVGLPEALRRAFAGFTHLTYADVGAFGRFRELMVLADERTFLEAQSTVLECCAPLIASQAGEHSEYCAAFLWAGTFLLPLGPSATAEERKLHKAALRNVGDFGNSDVHASGLASGELETLELFLAKQKNHDLGHEFFETVERMYLASLLEVEGAKAAPVLAAMKPTSPWEDDEDKNRRWCLLLAHLEHDAALEAMYGEHKKGFVWGTDGLVLSGHFDKARAVAFAHRKGDTRLAKLLEARCSPEVPMQFIPPEFSLAALSKETYAYEPPPSSRITLKPLETKVSLAPEQTWTDEERDAAETAYIFPHELKWNGKNLVALVSSSDGEKEELCTPKEQEEWMEIRERYAIPSNSNILAAAPKRFLERLYALGYVTKAQGLSRVMLRDGFAALPLLQLSLQEPDFFVEALKNAMPFGEASLAPPIIEAFSGKQLKALARSWLLRHPKHAALAAMVMLREKGQATAAARALRFLDGRGHRETILRLAEGEGEHARVLEVLSEDPLEMRGVKLPVLPKFATFASLPKLVRQDGKEATPAETERRLLELAFSNVDEPHPGVLAARSTYTQASRAEFVWKLFETWLALGADPKQVFCMQAVGFWGDDTCARKLAALAKEWPGESAAARAQAALDALMSIGSDTALMQISLLSEKSKYPAFKGSASQRIEMIALARSLKREELEDRLVPSLGLDEAGACVLDFGPRKFFLSLDEKLTPLLRNEEGKHLSELPKPAKSDNAALAKEAKAKLSGLRKDLKSLAALQLLRFERAMVLQRRWSLSDFKTFFVDHPVLTYLVRRLVLGAFAPDGPLLSTFRIAEDGTFADTEDSLWKQPGEAFSIGIPHPLELSEEARSAWARIFADYEMIQPFHQLGRAVYPLAPADKEAISCVNGKRFPAPKLVFGLEALGWRRYEIGDGGGLSSHFKNFGSVTAIVFYEGEVSIGYIEERNELSITELSLQGASGKLKPNELHPILYSEIVADLMKLTTGSP